MQIISEVVHFHDSLRPIFLRRAVSCTSSQHLSIYRTQHHNPLIAAPRVPSFEMLSLCLRNAGGRLETKTGDLFPRYALMNYARLVRQI